MNPAHPNRPYKPSQLSLGFPAKEPTLDALLVTEANESALAVLGAPQSWPFPVICLLGPPRCGLSVLARAWCQEFEGSYHVAKEFSRLKSRGLAALASGFVAVDDADRVKKSENLLTLINTATAEGGHVLLTSKHHPSQWQTQSADLKSRLMALPVIEIGEPDEKMLKARLESAAERYFLKLEPEVIKYLVPRLELSYEAIEIFIEKLNDKVTEAGRAPSVPLAREVVEELGWADPDQRSML
ncbi:DnaA/Hda family protein [Hyphomonas sp.]|uniref:DnaA ATPase domain-containing protein n=1 Tax=Hyphomonas sp. TaxID=87 RepID=UPI0025C017C4|nr:DnaA/Hda family protein [Hyphomonas sp.]